MKYSVPGEILDQATKCEHKFSCLETGKCGERPMCEVDYTNGEPVCFLKTSDPATCTYRVTFGGREVCACPVHFFIEQNNN